MTTTFEDYKYCQYLFGDYLLRSDGVLARENQDIHIPPKELEVLVLLLNAGGKIVSKEEIFDHVWCNIASDESLTRCIYALRKILCEDRNNRYIETVYGKGYRFKGQVAKISAHEHTDNITSVALFPFKMHNNVEILLHHTLIQGLSRYSCFGLNVLPASSTQECNDFNSINVLLNNLKPDYYITGREIANGQQTKLFIELVRAQNHRLVEHINIDYTTATEHSVLLSQIISLMVDKIPNLKINGKDINETNSFDIALICLNGRRELQSFTPDSLQKALSLFQLCINNNPHYSQPYCGLAECYIALAQLGLFDQNLALDNAVKAIDKSIELDPTNANALSLLALVSGLKGENSVAEVLFKQAHLLMPMSSDVNYYHSIFHFLTGRLKKGLELIDRSISLDSGKISGLVLKLWMTYYYYSHEKALVLGEYYIHQLSYKHPVINSMVCLFSALSGKMKKSEEYLLIYPDHDSQGFISANNLYSKYLIYGDKVFTEITTFINKVDFNKMKGSLLPLILVVYGKQAMLKYWEELHNEKSVLSNVWYNDPRLQETKPPAKNGKKHDKAA